MASESDGDIKHDIINNSSVLGEMFSTIYVVAPGETGKIRLKLKIDTGASDSALTLQTYRKLNGKCDPSKVIIPVKNTKLTAYDGQKIPCHDSHKGKLTKAKF